MTRANESKGDRRFAARAIKHRQPRSCTDTWAQPAADQRHQKVAAGDIRFLGDSRRSYKIYGIFSVHFFCDGQLSAYLQTYHTICIVLLVSVLQELLPLSLHKSATTKNIAELRMETGTSAFKRELCKQRNAPICSNCSRTFSHRNTPTYSSMPTASTSISHFSMLSTMCTSTPARAKRRKSHESPAQAPASQAENRRNASCGFNSSPRHPQHIKSSNPAGFPHLELPAAPPRSQQRTQAITGSVHLGTSRL